MRKGELGTESPRRVIFIFEGAVATLPDHYTVRMLERYKGRLHLYDQAVGYWKVRERTLQFMWTIMSRTFFRIDLAVTSRGPGFTQAVSRLVQKNNWPIEYVYCAEAQVLGRSLAHAPDVAKVFYALEEHRWCFGPQGYCIGPGKPMVMD